MRMSVRICCSYRHVQIPSSYNACVQKDRIEKFRQKLNNAHPIICPLAHDLMMNDDHDLTIALYYDVSRNPPPVERSLNTKTSVTQRLEGHTIPHAVKHRMTHSHSTAIWRHCSYLAPDCSESTSGRPYRTYMLPAHWPSDIQLFR